MSEKHFDITRFFPNELVLLSYLLSPDKSELNHSIEDIIKDNIDLRLFLKYVELHKLGPQAYANLLPYAHLLPASAMKQLKEHAVESAVTTLGLLLEHIRLDGLFKEKNIRCLTLKGPVMTSRLYGDCGLRPSVDVDIYINHKNISDAEEILSNTGYIRIKPAAGKGSLYSQLFKKYHKEYKFLNKETNLTLDLHYGILFNNSNYEQQYKDFFEGTYIETNINNVTFHTLNDENLLLYLSVHGSYHRYNCLMWLADIAWLIYIKGESFRWHEMIEKARRLDLLRPLVYSVVLSGIVFSTDVPNELETIYRSDEVINTQIADTLKIIAGTGDNKLQWKLRRIKTRASFFSKRSNRIKWYFNTGIRALVR